MLCHACQSAVNVKGKIFRSDECSQCSADLHCCLNCEHHDRSAHNQCREPQAEMVRDREKANFCDFFAPNLLKASRQKKPADEARRSFDDLFKK